MSTLKQRQPFEAPLVHTMDHRMLLLQRVQDIETLGNDQFKGGIYANAMPQSVMSFMLSLSNADIDAIRAKRVPINPVSGETRFTEEMRATLSEETLVFIDNVSREFNKMGDWPVEFLIQRDLGTHQIAEGFHMDSKSADATRQFRGFINISSVDADKDHETEWIAADGLTEAEMHEIQRQYARTSLEDLPELFKAHSNWIRSGDMFFTKGFGNGKRNILKDGPLHRAPPFKDVYPKIGERRDAFIWQRSISEVLDVG